MRKSVANSARPVAGKLRHRHGVLPTVSVITGLLIWLPSRWRLKPDARPHGGSPGAAE